MKGSNMKLWIAGIVMMLAGVAVGETLPEMKARLAKLEVEATTLKAAIAKAEATQPGATPTVQTAKVYSINDLNGQIPRDLWPVSPTKDSQKSIRHAHVDTLKGELVTVAFTIDYGNELGVSGKASGVNFCGVQANMIVNCSFGTKDYANLKGHKTGDTITVVGELDKADTYYYGGNEVMRHGLTLKNITIK